MLNNAFEIRRHTAESPWTYQRLDLRQREIAEKVIQGGNGKFLLSELAPVITMGRRTSPSDFALAKTELYPVDRGGFATYHGPGQWVLFPVDSLERLTGDRRGVRKIVDRLLLVASTVAKKLNIAAEIKQGAELGVWTEKGKFAALGIHVKNGVVLHGLSINGFATPESFHGLKPCGLDLPVSFLLESSSSFDELGRSVEIVTRELFQVQS